MQTPYYLIDADAIRHNLEILRGVMDRTGAHILLAQKAFSCYALYPMIGEYLSGATASGLYEARLCHEEMQQGSRFKVQGSRLENHIYSPAFREEDIDEIVEICDHIVFNSIHQLELYGKKAKEHGCQIGLRINPECSTQPSEHSIYDPCAPGSRLGVTSEELRVKSEELRVKSEELGVKSEEIGVKSEEIGVKSEECKFRNSAKTQGNIDSSLFTLHSSLPAKPQGNIDSSLFTLHSSLPAKTQGNIDSSLLTLDSSLPIDGLHFHTLCEEDSDDLETTLDAVIEKFGEWLPQMKWINFGGGHHITREGYDIERLERCIKRMQNDYGLEVYLEPGEAIALNAGTLHSTVLEVQPEGADGIQNVILDTSAACHMPDVLEMPYTPPLQCVLSSEQCVLSSEQHNDVNVLPSGMSGGRYRFGGPTCLSGDVIGTYNMDRTLHEGDEIVFDDMAIYSMVKNNTFNGMPLPSIYIKEGNDINLWKSFSYENFKSRL